ncbi:MAG: hypothetical protein ACFB50_03375 [Rubrobacteraceae bacterium]
MEVERPKRRHQRSEGKSDPIDAEAAGEPRREDGRVEMIRILRSARHSAVKSRSRADNQLQGFVVTVPGISLTIFAVAAHRQVYS